MQFLGMNCPSCGGPLQLPQNLDQVTCSHCGTALAVERGEGYAVLKIGQEIDATLQSVGAKTESAIREGTQVTRGELQRLQASQELTGLHIQLSSVQAEIRTLERERKSGKATRQLHDLRSSQRALETRIHQVSTLTGESTPAQSTPAAPDRKSAPPRHPLSRPVKGCLLGLLVYAFIAVCLAAIALPIDRALFHVTEPEGSSGPLFNVAMVVAVILALAFTVYYINPNASWVAWFRRKLLHTAAPSGGPAESDPSGPTARR